MTTPTIGITGATGGIGGRVARRLAERNIAQRLIVRDPRRAPAIDTADVAVAEYSDGAAMQAATRGLDTLLLVSAAEDPDRVTLHRTAIDAAVDAGVQRIVYTSFLSAAADATFTFARDHYWTEQHIRGSGVDFVFLRNSLYADYMPVMAVQGVIRGPAGDGEVALVTRDDIADVAKEVLTGDRHSRASYDVTGPELLTFQQIAALLGEVAGRDVTYVAETMEEARASRASYGAPAYEVEGWITSYAAVAAGELAVVTDTVERVAGHAPQSFEEFLRRTTDEDKE